MKKNLYTLQLTCILTAIWLILFEHFTWPLLLLGMAISFLAIRISERYFLGFTFYERYYFNLFNMALYMLFLVKEIYVAGIATLGKIITGDVHTDIINITTELPTDFQRSILANSITLTPGTVTLDVNDRQITVLWLDVKTKNQTLAGEIIKGKLERKLR
ncbi:Na+/H+ antiporter subunit E [Fusibacter paucivorans]|uniref:Na+/H+ antiporter subunit E n=1 Tax=Fusibacter paucivorans TaxID=76009 RepID=A0ABS5PLQ9_9FIRM|nr:Na+/H+ antiporter subunit E [Fusibacter paucivorans]MBS7526103.1 Na+/H+ antiporter subunit E [Fusibacter paucivorans]